VTVSHARGQGSASKYKAGCRCAECREASRIYGLAYRQRERAANSIHYQRDLAASRRAKENQRGSCERCGTSTAWKGGNGRDKSSRFCRECFAIVNAWQHGTNSGYTSGCKCAECKAAHAAYMRDYYRRRKAAA
jgi:hypothetical protein